MLPIRKCSPNLLRRLPDVVRADEVAALVLANLIPEIASALAKGAFVVLTPNVVRLRYLPRVCPLSGSWAAVLLPRPVRHLVVVVCLNRGEVS